MSKSLEEILELNTRGFSEPFRAVYTKGFKDAIKWQYQGESKCSRKKSGIVHKKDTMRPGEPLDLNYSIIKKESV